MSCRWGGTIPTAAFATKGDKYNVKVEWENGEVSYEPALHTIAADDHMMCVINVKDYGLLDTDGWKRTGFIGNRLG
jgi:hypothetical protein